MPISSHLSNLPYIVMWPSHLKSISIWPIGATYPIGRCLESCDSYTEYPTNTNIFAHYINKYTGWSHITTPRTQVLLQTSWSRRWIFLVTSWCGHTYWCADLMGSWSKSGICTHIFTTAIKLPTIPSPTASSPNLPVENNSPNSKAGGKARMNSSKPTSTTSTVSSHLKILLYPIHHSQFSQRGRF